MSAQLINIVLDLETTSIQENAGILQIGAAVPLFDQIHLPESVSPTFEVTISYDGVLSYNFHVDGDTMQWWQQQDAETRRIVFSGQEHPSDALQAFADWVKEIKSTGADVAIWGNGADFDNRILAYSLDYFNISDVWSFRHNRCLRTVRALFPVTVMNDPTEIKHTALGDAKYEARILNEIYLKHGLLV